MARYILTLVVLSVTAGLHITITNAQVRAAQSSFEPVTLNIPAEIMGYRQARPDIPVAEDIREQLETNTILIRDYFSPFGMPVNLTIVYAETTRRSLHFPEVCFTGQGWEVGAVSSIPVGFLFVGKGLVLQRSDAREAVLYWFKTGDRMTGSYFLNSYYWARDMLLFRSPSSMLVRLSTPVASQDDEAAFLVLNDFASALAPVLLETIR